MRAYVWYITQLQKQVSKEVIPQCKHKYADWVNRTGAPKYYLIVD